MDEQLRAEALRVYGRYATEVVEALGFCPWARRAREQGRVSPQVLLSSEPRPAEVLAMADAMFAGEHIDIGLIILPRVSWDSVRFRHFVAQVREHDAARQPGPPALAMADFHPGIEPDTSTPARLVPFVRCSPDPTIQLVRRAALEAVQGSGSQGTSYAPQGLLGMLEASAMPAAPMHQRIAEANHETVLRLGVAQVRALLDDIRADRDRAYARIAESFPGSS